MQARLAQDAELRRTDASPMKSPIVLVGCIRSEAVNGVSAIKYFASSAAGKAYDCKIGAFTLPATLVEYKRKLAGFCEKYDVVQLFIIAHGATDGSVELSKGVLVQQSDLALQQPGPVGSFTTALHCYGDNAPDMERTRVFADRQIGCNLSVAASRKYTGGKVWMVPRELVDGQEGWVHCGLNPEVMKDPEVKQAIERRNLEIEAKTNGDA